MKSILAILLTLFGSWGAPAQEIQEGMLGPLPAMAANLRNPASHPAEWASLKEFLEKDDSNKHFYREGVYDCKHFSLELFRRAQTNEMACYIVLIRFAEIQEGHSVICFPTMDKGDVFVDFTPIQMRDHQEPMKAIAMIAPRQPRIQVPLQQVPDNFTNDAAFFISYQAQQPLLHEAAALLASSQKELSDLQEQIETLQQNPHLTQGQKAELGKLSDEYAEKYRRYQAATEVYRSYEKDWKSPFDSNQEYTVINITRY
jgi:hypothetical protein